MFLEAGTDIFGKPEHFTADRFRHILDLVDGYMKGIPYEIHEIRQDDAADKNGRIDIVIRYEKEGNQPVLQKLLILKDELIDGEAFHKRREEWYN